MTTQARQIATRRYEMPDQAFFAELSGDRNPMHMDPAAARRLITGRPVVHGIHLLMTALEHWAHDAMHVPTQIECSFANPVSVGDTVLFRQSDRGSEASLIELVVDDLVCCKIRISCAAQPPDAAAAPETSVEGARTISAADAPVDVSPQRQLEIGRHVLRAVSHAGPTRFPRLASWLGPEATAALPLLSTFVGMVCPGLHSIFSSVSLKPGQGERGRAQVRFDVDRYDERFHLFHVSFDGALRGALSAFQRPPPQSQPTMAQLAGRVAADEFADVRALVIGASRGLGETVAKLLAGGGADVTAGYAHGHDDAQRVAAEIEALRPGRSRILHVDVTLADWLERLPFERLDAIYLFATPRIGRKKAGAYVPALFAEFVASYVDVLHALCDHVERRRLPHRIEVCVPSTVFIDERPDGFAEYAMAKAAMEVLAAEINRTCRRVRVHAPRLPRLSTDQTASVLKLATADTVDALLPILRTMADRSRTATARRDTPAPPAD